MIQHTVPTENFLFMLAYAFKPGWDYDVKEIAEAGLEDSAYLECFVFFLLRGTEELIRHGLYRTYIETTDEVQKIRGRIDFQRMVLAGHRRKRSITCTFDDLSFDTIENQIILSTLFLAKKEFGRDLPRIGAWRRQWRHDLSQRLNVLITLLSPEISYVPYILQLFERVQIHRSNASYQSLLFVCRVINESISLAKSGTREFYDIPNGVLDKVFERFLRHYLIESLGPRGLSVGKEKPLDWASGDKDRQVSTKYIPAIEPDIVIRKIGKPVFVIDAKFHKSPVYYPNIRFRSDDDEAANEQQRTHSSGLYQLITYISFFNCDGLLVYSQTEEGHFFEEAWINPKHYGDTSHLDRSFGFYTLDLSGDIRAFRERLDTFSEMLVQRIEAAT